MTYPQQQDRYVPAPQQAPPLPQFPGMGVVEHRRILHRIEAAAWMTLAVATIGTAIAAYFLYEFIRFAEALNQAFGH